VVLGSFVVQGVKSFVVEWWLTHVEVSLVVPRHKKNPGFELVENAMVDGAATGPIDALQ